MKNIWAAVLALFGIVCAPAMAAPLEAYGQLPSLEDVVVSPDGTMLAFVQQVGAKRLVIIHSLTEQKPIGGLQIGDVKLRSLHWAGNGHVLLTRSETATAYGLSNPRHEWVTVDSFDIERKKLTSLRSGDDATMNTVVGQPEWRVIDGHPTAIVQGVHFPPGKTVGELMLFSQDLTSGRQKSLEMQSPDATGWLVDASGAAVAQSDYREYTKHWSLKFKRGAFWKEVFGIDAPIDRPELEGISTDGSSVVMKLIENGDVKFKTVNEATGELGPELEPKYRFSEYISDPGTGRLIGGRNITTRFEYGFFDQKDQDAWSKVLGLFPNASVELQSWSDDHKKMLVRVSGPLDGDAYRLVDVDTSGTVPVGPAYEGIAAADVAPVRGLIYTAADGTKIPAFLTLPAGRPAKDLPLVVLAHGGPAARDEPGFDWWAQALASRGYAVLQPEFRGSAGFGLPLFTAGFGEFGRKMQTDLSDGVRDLVKLGVVDPKRVCIVGASYGGYAALAGPTLDPGVYRCAVSVAGISDLRHQMEWIRTSKGTDASIRFWDRFLGVKDEYDPLLNQISPITYVAKVDVPILLIHGRDDTVVKFDQSERMADALKHAGKPVELVELKGEDHWLSRSETRLQMLRATVEFLEKNNPPN